MTLVTSSNLCNQAPLFMKLRLLQATINNEHCVHKFFVLSFSLLN